MARKLCLIFIFLFLAGCGAKKKAARAEARTITVAPSIETPNPEPGPDTTPPPDAGYASSPDKIEQIINTALGYSGVRYRFGGTTEQGMDCSGLLYVSFKAHDIALPRVSHEMADEGRRIRVEAINKGDLLFFTTTKRGRKINHVGLVVAVEEDDIKFIHSTTSRGVIVSSLREGFWNYSFVKATRIL